MSAPFVSVDLHSMTVEEADRAIAKALASVSSSTYQIRLIHGFNRGTAIRAMIRDYYGYDPKVKRILPGENPGVTVLVLKELY